MVEEASIRVDEHRKTPNEVTATSSTFNWDFDKHASSCLLGADVVDPLKNK